MAIKRKKNKEDSVKKYWEVIAPEPFILDPEIVDEEFISDVVSMENDDDITEYVTNSLHQPNTTFIIFCSKNELYKKFCGECEKFVYAIKDYNGTLILVVEDKKSKEPIGRGEIIPLGNKVSLELATEFMDSHFEDFYDRFEKGKKRVDTLMYKIKSLRIQMSKLPPMTGSKNLLS